MKRRQGVQVTETDAPLTGCHVAEVPWTSWARWIVPLQLPRFALGCAALFVAVSIGY